MSNLPESMRERIRKLVTSTAWEVKVLHNGYDVAIIEDDEKLHELIDEELDACTNKLLALLEEVDHKARIEAKIEEHKVIQVGIVEAFNEAAAEGDSYNALHIFDDWRASRYRDLLRKQSTKQAKEQP